MWAFCIRRNANCAMAKIIEPWPNPNPISNPIPNPNPKPNPNPDPNPIPHPKPNPKANRKQLRHLHCAEYRMIAAYVLHWYRKKWKTRILQPWTFVGDENSKITLFSRSTSQPTLHKACATLRRSWRHATCSAVSPVCHNSSIIIILIMKLFCTYSFALKPCSHLWL